MAVAVNILGYLTLILLAEGSMVAIQDDATSIEIAYESSSARFSKANGALLESKFVNQSLTSSRMQCLWGYISGSNTYAGGCEASYNVSWRIDTAALAVIFNYTPVAETSSSPDCRPTVMVSVQASSLFNTSLALTFELLISSAPCGSHLSDQLLWPSDLVLDTTTADNIFLPVLPGIVLHNSLFNSTSRGHTIECPGRGCFTDATSWTSGSARFAMVSHARTDPRRVDPSTLSINTNGPADWFLHRALLTSLTPDKLPYHAPTLTMVMGPFNLTQLAQYTRSVRNVEQSPSLADKLGPRFRKFASAPLLKVDAVVVGNLTFDEYNTVFEERLDRPMLLHLAGYEPVAFDHYYPDMLPPNPKFGTTADMQAMVAKAQQAGHLFMPYSNPTWWDVKSRTVLSWLQQGFPLTSFSALNSSMQPYFKSYDAGPGVVVEPNNARVQARVAQLLTSLTTNISSDAVFQDQIGARPWQADYSPNIPGFLYGWINQTEAAAAQGHTLMTEQGFDHLVTSHVSFCGSMLLSEITGDFERLYGTTQVDYFPFASIMLRDKVLLQQHNLAGQAFVTSLNILSYNLAMGYALSFQLSFFRRSDYARWYRPTTVLQQRFVSKFTGKTMLDFTVLQRNATSDTVTLTTYQTTNVIRVTGNESYAARKGTLSPQGFEAIMVQNGQTAVAGAYRSYNNHTLNASCATGPEHVFLTELNSSQATTMRVFYLLGCDTDLVLTTPCGAGLTLRNASVTVLNVHQTVLSQQAASINSSRSEVTLRVGVVDAQLPVSRDHPDVYVVDWTCS